MRVILAPHVDVPARPRPRISWDELVRYGEVEVSSDSRETVNDVVHRVISEQRPDLVGAEPEVDAAPFSADLWWLATVRREGDLATVQSFEPADAFGIDEDGLVHFVFPKEMPLSYLARAIAEGHYASDEDYLVVTRAGEFGGNGFLITSLVLWLLQEVPAVLLGVGADRAVLRRDTKRQEELEALALDWAGRHILYPSKLKQFVESKNAWFPTVLGQRLALDEPSARRLLDALGYELSPHNDHLFEYSDSQSAQAIRQQWDDAQWAATFTSLGELLEAGGERPEEVSPMQPPEDMTSVADKASRSTWSRLRRWVTRG